MEWTKREIDLVHALEDACEQHIGLNYALLARRLGVCRERVRQLAQRVAAKCKRYRVDPPVRCDGLRPLVCQALSIRAD